MLVVAGFVVGCCDQWFDCCVLQDCCYGLVMLCCWVWVDLICVCGVLVVFTLFGILIVLFCGFVWYVC